MKINFEKIQLHNFMSFTDATIQLNTPGYILVSGENNNKEDNSTSNGSGKSAIFEGLLWCLTGETQRHTTKVLKLGTKEGFVTVWFSLDNDQYEITRTITK